MRTPLKAAVLVPLMLLALGCAPQAAARRPPTTPRANATQTPADCAQGKTLTDGVLTVGTDSPAYDPWFSNNDPTNGKGYESAVAYAVAKQLGFDDDRGDVGQGAVQQRPTPRATKNFDFDINQISITPGAGRRSSTSPTATTPRPRRVIALKDSPAAKATIARRPQGPQARRPDRHHVADRDPRRHPADHRSRWSSRDTNVAKQALLNGQVDAIVADLPTAFYITAVRDPVGHDRRPVPAAERAARSSSACSSRRATRWSPASTRRWRRMKSDGTLDADREEVAQPDA